MARAWRAGMVAVLAALPLVSQETAPGATGVEVPSLAPETLSLLANAEAVMARSALAEGLPAKALFHLDQALAMDRRDPRLHAMQGLALVSVARYGRAAEAYLRALRLARELPNEEQALLPIGLWAAQWARALLQAGRGPEAEAALELARTRGLPAATMKLERGWAALINGTLQEAELSARQLLQEGDERLEVFLVLAESLLGLGRPDEALQALEGREDPEALGVRARILEALGRDEEAERTREQAVDGERRRAEGRAALSQGVQALEEGDLEKAQEELARASDLMPLSAAAEAYHGVLEAREGRTERAEAAFRRALFLDPANPVALGGLADLRVGTGDLHGALPWFQAAARRNPDSLSLQMRLGAVYTGLGRLNDAMQAYRTARDLAPLDPHPFLAMAALQEALGRPRTAASLKQRAAVLSPPPPPGARPPAGGESPAGKRSGE